MVYCTAYDSFNVTGYQGLFCLLNKPFCDRWLGCIQLIKAGGRGVFVVKSGYFYLENWGDF